MSTAARFIETETLVPAEHVHSAIAETGRLSRELLNARARIARLERALTAAMLPYSGHRTEVVDGTLTVVLNAGDTYQRVARAIDRPGASGYEWHWQKLAPIPGSPAALAEAELAEVDLPRDGMGCYAGDEQVAS